MWLLRHEELGRTSPQEHRKQLRPIPEKALATNERVHPFAARFKKVIDEELDFYLGYSVCDGEMDTSGTSFLKHGSESFDGLR